MSKTPFPPSSADAVTFTDCMYLNLSGGHYATSTPQRLQYSELPPKSNNKTIYRLVCISDTHNEHANLILPPGDLLVHAGDILTESGQRHTKEVDINVNPTTEQTQQQKQQASGKWSWLCGSKKKDSQSSTEDEDENVVTEEYVNIPTGKKRINSFHGDQLVDNFLQWFGRQSHPHKVLIGGNHDLCLQNLGKQRVRSTLERYSQGSAMYLEHEAAFIGNVKVFGSPFAHFPSKNRAYRKETEELEQLDYSDLSKAHLFITHMPLILPRNDGTINHVDPLSLKLHKYNEKLVHISGHCHWAYNAYRTRFGVPSIIASTSSPGWHSGSNLKGDKMGLRGDKSDARYGGYNIHFPPWVIDIEVEQGIPTAKDKWSLVFSNHHNIHLQHKQHQVHEQKEQKEVTPTISAATIQPSKTATATSDASAAESHKPSFLLFAPGDHQDLADRVVPALKECFQVYHCTLASQVLQLLATQPDIQFEYCLSKLGTRENKVGDFFPEIRKHNKSSRCKIIIHSATAANDSAIRKNLDDKFIIHQFIKEKNEQYWLNHLIEEMKQLK